MELDRAVKKQYVYFTATVEGLHNYPNAKGVESYLKNIHRHNFIFKGSLQVFIDDREIEFIDAKREFVQALNKTFGSPCDFKSRSCEELCNVLLEFLVAKFGNKRDYYVEVSEDGENGAVKKFER